MRNTHHTDDALHWYRVLGFMEVSVSMSSSFLPEFMFNPIRKERSGLAHGLGTCSTHMLMAACNVWLRVWPQDTRTRCIQKHSNPSPQAWMKHAWLLVSLPKIFVSIPLGLVVLRTSTFSLHASRPENQERSVSMAMQCAHLILSENHWAFVFVTETHVARHVCGGHSVTTGLPRVWRSQHACKQVLLAVAVAADCSLAFLNVLLLLHSMRMQVRFRSRVPPYPSTFRSALCASDPVSSLSRQAWWHPRTNIFSSHDTPVLIIVDRSDAMHEAFFVLVRGTGRQCFTWRPMSSATCVAGKAFSEDLHVCGGHQFATLLSLVVSMYHLSVLLQCFSFPYCFQRSACKCRPRGSHCSSKHTRFGVPWSAWVRLDARRHSHLSCRKRSACFGKQWVPKASVLPEVEMQ